MMSREMVCMMNVMEHSNILMYALCFQISREEFMIICS